jgi:diguanylate cyclase (GGDEF)-like protein/PAS domain S-box-containing protein
VKARILLSPVTRISAGLVALLFTLVMVFDAVFGLVPSDTEMLRQVRASASESLAVQITTLIGAGDYKTATRSIEEVMRRNDQMRSVAVRRSDGRIIVQVGDHERFWIAPPDGRSTLDHVRVPVFAERQPWGDIEIAFASSLPNSLRAWAAHPTVLLVAALVVCGFAAFYLYLRRALQYLDPTAAIPERVRTAFDALTEAVMVLDTKGRIVLSNARFRRQYGADLVELQGKSAAALPWAASAWSGDAAQPPWMRAMADRVTVRDEPLDIKLPDQSSLHALVSSAPIEDGHGRLRGCMVTLSDITELHRTNDKLRATLRDLEASRQQIREKNKELTHLATSDPLTGCLNRRAFFAELQLLFGRLRDEGTPLSCIMADIDHFKQINDRFGHAVGDQVIAVVAKTLGSGLREGDLLCRYGGEEFCIILPASNLEDATRVAERLRRDIESKVGPAVAQAEELQVTASFGVAVYREVMRDSSDLIKYADEGLYRAKRAGRNRTRRTVYLDNAAEAQASVD